MPGLVPWDNRPLTSWEEVRPPGYVVDLGGRRTHFVRKGSGPPLLLIHGFNLDLNSWLANVDALARHFTVIAVDLWGFGYSTREPLDWGFPLYSQQIRELMDHLAIPRAHLVGHSMGGGVAIAAAVDDPERVDRLVLVASVGGPRTATLRERLFRLPWLPELLLRLPTDAIRRRNLRDLWIRDPELLTPEVFAALTGFQRVAGSIRTALAILRRDFFGGLDAELDRLAALGIPTLLVWGRHDRAVPVAAGRELHRRLSGSRLELFGRSSHLPNFDEPDRFNDLLVTFLQDGSDPRTSDGP